MFPEQPAAYLNGEFLPLHQACVPVLDRGFIFGDGVYEVIPIYAGRPFRLAHHLQRLANSLAAVRIDNPHTDGEWEGLIAELVRRNGEGDQSVYLQVTRGIAPRDHRFPADSRPTVFLMSNPFKPVPEAELRDGVAAVTLNDFRWELCHIKSISLLPNILLRQQAVEHGAAEAILLRNGKVTEGAASNVFIVSDDVIVTPPKGDCLLPGITRDLVVELAMEHGLPCEERDIPENELRRAGEIWLTSSTREILPVTRLDDIPVGDGRPGPVWRDMLGHYHRFVDTLRRPA